MKNGGEKLLLELMVISLLINLLLFSKETFELASRGLLIWYKNMIPSLFPFMVLSGFLVKTGMANKISSIFHPVLGRFFPFSPAMLYAIIMGFLCGFPMGAKVVSDLLESKQISGKQGEYLLAFCNNIGPIYMMSYVVPLFGWKNTGSILAIMYGVPLAYGIFLRFQRKYRTSLGIKDRKKQGLRIIAAGQNAKASVSSLQPLPFSGEFTGYLEGFQSSLQSAIHQITLLGGCMVFFNCLQIYPDLLGRFFTGILPHDYRDFFQGALCCLLEVGGGLDLLASALSRGREVHAALREGLLPSFFFLSEYSYLSLAFLTFGGLSCIIQTCFIIRDSGLSAANYVKHKLIQTVIVLLLLPLL